MTVNTTIGKITASCPSGTNTETQETTLSRGKIR